MQLDEALNMIWAQQVVRPQTSKEALGRLSESIRYCLEAFEQDQLVHTQVLLEDTLPQILIAMKTLGIEPSAALRRAMSRMSQQSNQRAFHIYPDRVEIWAEGECRGNWPLYSDEDYRNVTRLARELGCEIIHSDSRQLGLFQNVKELEAPGV